MAGGGGRMLRLPGRAPAEARRRLVDHHHSAAKDKDPLQLAAPWPHPCRRGVQGRRLEIRAASADLRLPNVLDSVTPHPKQPPQQDQNGSLIRLSALITLSRQRGATPTSRGTR